VTTACISCACGVPATNNHPTSTPQEEALAELEAELSALRESAAAAEAEGARAVALEGSLSAAKDQYLRLQADFDNFRRRTVRGVRGWTGLAEKKSGWLTDGSRSMGFICCWWQVQLGTGVGCFG
jgi:hypothetical protein